MKLPIRLFTDTLVCAALVASCCTSLFAAEPTSKPGSDPKLPTLFVIGDSTVHNGTRGQQGWGDPLKQWVDPTKFNVENHAMGGRSSRTFITEGRWDAVLKTAKPGDVVIMQFGHNDGGPLSGDNRERGSIRGTGDESKEVTLTLGANKDKKETVHTYGWYLRKYIEDAKAKGMTPIVCSPIPHVPKDAVKLPLPSSRPAGYATWAREVAEAEHVGFIELENRIVTKYEGMDPKDVKTKYFTEADNTHTSPAGAALNAQCVVEGLRDLKDAALDPLKAALRDAPAAK